MDLINIFEFFLLLIRKFLENYLMKEKKKLKKKEEKKILEGEEQKMFNLLLNQVVALLLKEVPDKIEVDKIKDYLKQEKIQEIFGKVLSNTNLQEFEKNMKNEEKKKKEEKTSDL
jgi:hypothetical protein